MVENVIDNSIDSSVNDGIVAIKENEEEAPIQNPEVLVKQELQKLSDKMVELKNSLGTLKKIKQLSETPLKAK